MLEITETALLKATGPTMATLTDLRSLGVKVVIDDFGTGYFSLSHLRQFPVDALKIASEFVQVSNADARSAALAGAIVALSQSLDIIPSPKALRPASRRSGWSPRLRLRSGLLFARPMEQADIDTGAVGLARAVRRNAVGGRMLPGGADHAGPRPRGLGGHDPPPHPHRPDRGLTPRGRVISPGASRVTLLHPAGAASATAVSRLRTIGRP